MSKVRYEVDGPVSIVTIDRPEVRNAVDGETAAALVECFQRFEADDERCVAVLTGADGCFCAGADLHAVSRGTPGRANEIRSGPLGPTHMDLGKPVIAAVEGHAVAGGLELALWCDLRVAAENAVFGVFCRRWGVPLIDGGTVRLPRLVGHSFAMDMILSGRGVCGDEARNTGLANRLVAQGQALNEAIVLAKQLAAFPQRCLRSDRISARKQWGLTEADALVEEKRLGIEVIRSGETREGARRFSAGAGRHGHFE
ncbi:crotonase/enoyl-CoA hydratase family protein [Myxococcota bacterium]|nr:crotonase/enoyl-CoA hydratase family protein [Myxococcota bacterium]